MSFHAKEHDSEYDSAFGIFVEAFQRAKETLPNSAIVPALVDFTTMIGVVAEGEDGVRAMMQSMERRIEAWNMGQWPVENAKRIEPLDRHHELADALIQRETRALLSDGDNPHYPELTAAMRRYVTEVNARLQEDGRTDMIVSEENGSDIATMDVAMAEAIDTITTKRIPLDYLLDFFADFAAYLPLRLTGDQTIVQAKIKRLKSRLADWKAGKVPALG
jgi:hypothetical protein